jgi:hypothetical protein
MTFPWFSVSLFIHVEEACCLRRVGFVDAQIEHALGGAGIMTHVYSVPYKWVRVSSAPSDANLEVCVMDNHGIHALVFPCRKNGTEWVDASTKKHVDIQPTHWRKWIEI